jgi:hypothetical protein
VNRTLGIQASKRMVLVVALLALTAPVAMAQKPAGWGAGESGCGADCGSGRAGSVLTTFVTNDFAGSGNSAGNDVSIDTHWRSTMMANFEHHYDLI